MAEVLRGSGSSSQYLPAGPSSPRTQSLPQLERIISSLESKSPSHLPEPCLVLPALQALEGRVQALKTQSSSASTSRDVDALSARVRQLIRQVVTQQTIDSRASSTRISERDSLQPYFSSASMARYLEGSIKQSSSNAASHSSISLPPVPKLVVDSTAEQEGETVDDAAREKVRLRQEAEEAEMAEYEAASRLRRKGGYKAANDEDGAEKAGGAKDEKTSTTTYPPTTSTAPVVSGDRSTQEALSSELLRMASILKNQTISFSSALERDRKLLESTDQQLSQNLDLMTRTRGRLGEYAHKARGMGWLTLGTVIMVVITWMLMFVVIKLT